MALTELAVGPVLQTTWHVAVEIVVFVNTIRFWLSIDIPTSTYLSKSAFEINCGDNPESLPRIIHPACSNNCFVDYIDSYQQRHSRFHYESRQLHPCSGSQICTFPKESHHHIDTWWHHPVITWRSCRIWTENLRSWACKNAVCYLCTFLLLIRQLGASLDSMDRLTQAKMTKFRW